MFSAFILSLCFILIISNNTFLWSTFYGRISKAELKDDNAQDRFIRWKLSFDYFLDHPVNGSMLKNQYYPDKAARFIEVDYSPHNFIFEILATQGIVGFIFYLYILFKAISIGFKNRKDLVSYQMLLILLFYVLFSTFNGSFFDKYNVLILVMGISILLMRNKSLHRNEGSLVY